MKAATTISTTNCTLGYALKIAQLSESEYAAYFAIEI